MPTKLCGGMLHVGSFNVEASIQDEDRARTKYGVRRATCEVELLSDCGTRIKIESPRPLVLGAHPGDLMKRRVCFVLYDMDGTPEDNIPLEDRIAILEAALVAKAL